MSLSKNSKIGELVSAFNDLDQGEKILFLEWLHKAEPHKWDFATMPESLRRFYSSEPRPEHRCFPKENKDGKDA